MKLRNCWGLGLLGWVMAAAAEPPKPTANPPAPPEATADELYQTGKDLFDSLATPEMKEQFAFPDKAQWDTFAARLQAALESDRLEDLVAYEGEARAALAALRVLPGYEDYADWLQERLDYIEAAKQATQAPSSSRPPIRPTGPEQTIPHYDLWLERLRTRPKPAGADEIMPPLGAAFASAGLPAELAWLAEAESSLNPRARSPAGARGLYQLMPATAKELGLSTFLPDDRTDPKKSARAAAQLLRTLYGKFGSWPLALAAYNAGAGRVQHLLEQRKASTFAAIAPALPSETRMYVPKVLALLQVRTGVPPTSLAPPRI
jgi:membrane-bound lytic murein transglycosylase D